MAKAATKFHGTGRRKKSIARVYLTPGKGNIVINKRSIDEYFGLETLKVIVRQPLAATDTADKFDILVNVKGGGYTGQAGAIRHGIARALLTVDADYRPVLKKAGYLTRDPRMKERKKSQSSSSRSAVQQALICLSDFIRQFTPRIFSWAFFVSEEGNQATAQLSFGFTRAYNEKIRKHGVRLMRSGRIFEYERGRKPCNKILFIKKHFIWLSQ